MKQFYIYILLCLLFFSCTDRKDDLSRALEAAGTNRAEMEKVLHYYENDRLKWQAAVFLIENMPYHFGYDCNYRQIPDITALSADYLIENIDLAFQVWPKPWNRTHSFTDFCRYILPYRCLYEPASRMRKLFMETYLPLLDSLQPKTSLEAARIIHSQLHLTFMEGVPRNYPTVEEIYQTRTGKCDGMLLLSTHIMRAVGIPAMVDYTQWPQRDGDHYWGNILNNDGECFPYAPENEPPSELKPHLTQQFLTPAVVYRYEFAPFLNQAHAFSDSYRTPLKNPLLRVVTNEYLAPTFDIRVNCDYPTSHPQGLVYLCNYNNRQWRPLVIGERIGEICRFADIVGDNIFIVAEENAIYPGTLQYITCPFYVDSCGILHKFQMQKGAGSLYIPKEQEKYADVLQTLTYWDMEEKRFIHFNYLCDTLVNGYFLRNVPSNSLLRALIDKKGKMGGERIFFIQNDTIRRY